MCLVQVGWLDGPCFLFDPQQFPDQIVGFVPRKHVVTAGLYSYGSFELQDPELGGGDRYDILSKHLGISTAIL